MKRFLAALAAFVVLGFAIPAGQTIYRESTAFERGAAQARDEVTKGRVGFKLNGIPNSNARRLFALLEAKGIPYSAMDAGDSYVFKERNGYNSVMISSILERNGIDIAAVLRGDQPVEKQ